MRARLPVARQIHSDDTQTAIGELRVVVRDLEAARRHPVVMQHRETVGVTDLEHHQLAVIDGSDHLLAHAAVCPAKAVLTRRSPRVSITHRFSISDRVLEHLHGHECGSTVDRRQRRREAKLAQILDAAWTLAHRDGLAGISLRDLADRVDLRQPSLYAYFESKLDLYDAMFADGNRQLLEAAANSTPSERPCATRSPSSSRCSCGSRPRTSCATSCCSSARSRASSRRRPRINSHSSSTRSDGRAAAAGVTDDSDFDMFTALVVRARHQQVANDPGGDRWVRLTARAVEMFFADVDRRRRRAWHEESQPHRESRTQ